MKDSCEKYRLKIMDMYYNEILPDEDTLNHIQKCQSCSEFREKLTKMETGIQDYEYNFIPDDRIIKSAINKANSIIERKKKMKELLVFITLITLIMTGVILVSYFRESLVLLKLQLVLGLICPLIIPFAVKRKLAGGER